jgi:hypothetical protein
LLDLDDLFEEEDRKHRHDLTSHLSLIKQGRDLLSRRTFWQKEFFELHGVKLKLFFFFLVLRIFKYLELAGQCCL